jgi:hypothetical protein
MTKGPTTAPIGSMLTDAVEIMAERKISELPVVDNSGRPLGLLDITDVVALFPEGQMPLRPAQSSKPAPIPAPKNPAFFRTAVRAGQTPARGENSGT